MARPEEHLGGGWWDTDKGNWWATEKANACGTQKGNVWVTEKDGDIDALEADLENMVPLTDDAGDAEGDESESKYEKQLNGEIKKRCCRHCRADRSEVSAHRGEER